jgi:hypothetical protein
LYTFVAFIFSSYGILFSIVTDYFDSMDFIFSFPVFLLVTSILYQAALINTHAPIL